MDSSGAKDLLDQAGTLQRIVGGTEYDLFFWELYPLNAEQTSQSNGLSLPSISPNDVVDVSVNHNGSGTSLITLLDETKNTGAQFQVSWKTNYIEEGEQAEWIMERDAGSYYPQLADYDHIRFSDDQVANQTTNPPLPLGDTDRFQWFMWNCPQTVRLSAPDYLTDGSSSDAYFGINWENSGTGDQNITTKQCNEGFQ